MESGAGGSSRRKNMPLKVRLTLGAGGAKGQEKVNGSKEKQKDNDVEIQSASESNDSADIPDLPEGTVVVKPEPVQEKTIRFRGPEFKPANKKGSNGGGATSNSAALENLFCTACGRQVNPWKTGMVKKHKDLRVIICKKCFNFLESGEIAQDEDGMDEQCRWCGEGGRLTICDKCPRAYCKGCIMRNFGRAAFTAVTESENWECYCCNPEPLAEHKKHCRTVFDTIKAADSKKLVKSSQASSAPSNNSKSSSSRSSSRSQRNGTANGKQEASGDSDKDSDSKRTSKRREKTTPKKESKAKKKGSDDDDENNFNSASSKAKKVKKCKDNSDEEEEKGAKKKSRSDGPKKENGSGDKKKEKPQIELDSSEEDEMLEREIDKLVEGFEKRQNKKKEVKEEDDDDGDDDDEDDENDADEEDDAAAAEEDTSSKKKDKGGKGKAQQAAKGGRKKTEEDSSDSSKSDDEDDNDDEDEEMDDSSEEMVPKSSKNGNKNRNADMENELAKAAMDDDDDDNDNDDVDDEDEDKSNEEDSSSSESDVDPSKKTRSKKLSDKKKGEKSKEAGDDDEEEDEEEDDSDMEQGESRKRFKSSLLDAKISDSDSEIEINRKKKGKKRKRDSDNDSFDADKASGGEDDEGGDSVVDSDEVSSQNSDVSEGSTKGKKKGKGKGKDKEKDKGKEKGKRRKRIKRPKDSSSDDEPAGDGEDGEEPGSRKKIRKIKSDKKLGDTTKAAAKAEEDRRKRIQDRQKKFNGMEQKDAGDGNAPITTKLVLEQDEDSGKPIIQVNRKLICKLKPHQVEAVQFMWDCMFESLERSKKQINSAGCILAHCMGLGKTLSVVSFVHTMMMHKKLTKVKSCLVVSPLNTVLNWQNEFQIWLDEEDQLPVYEMASVKQNNARADVLEEWHRDGGIMIIGYEMLRNLSTGSRVRNKKQKAIFQKTLIDPGPDMVVCDEGHVMKNAASALSKSMNTIKTRRRVVLTGTPLQNNLIEYHCMVNFVKPNLLGTKKEFANRFVNPIINGQHKDSTSRDVRIMKNRAHVLHELLAGCVQRRDYSALTKFLPPKQEYVISVRLSEIQMKMYDEYMKRSGLADGVITTRGAQLFKDYQSLMKIWTHPWVMKLAEIRDDLKMKYDDEDSFIDDEYSDEEKSLPSSNSSSSSEEDVPTKEKSDVDESAGEGPSTGRRSSRLRNKESRRRGDDKDEIVKEWKTKSRGGDGELLMEVESGPQPVSSDWWAEFVSEEDESRMELSGKLVLLFDILRMCEEIGDKVLIFSQSLLSLDIIEYFLEHIDTKFTEETQDKPDEELKEEFGKRWTKGEDYFRLDGSTSAQMRQLWASIFNDPENLRARLFLISTRAGGLGINLVGANRVIIFDASWNPSHDVQSIFRVYRFGQTKPCYIYRFLAQGTMEEKIYDRQVIKLSLSQRVVDEHQVERHFTAADLSELYSFKPERLSDDKEKETIMLPKDVLLAEIVAGENRDWFVAVHEHDSLLENQVEQELTEEEKKAAWEEYENEKKGLRMNVGNMGQGAAGLASYLSQEFLLQTARNLRMQHPDMPQEVLQMHLQRIIMMQIRQKQEEQRRLEMMEQQQASQFMQMQQRYAQLQQQYLQQMGQQSGASMYGMPGPGQRFSPSLYAHMAQPGISAFHGGAAAAVKSTAKSHSGSSNDAGSDKPDEVIDLDGSSD